jgi:hypothetical protein
MLFAKLFKYTIAVLKALSIKYGIWFYIVAIIVWFFGLLIGLYIKSRIILFWENRKKRKSKKL